MRTTVDFDADTGDAVERLRMEHGLGVSEAVNELIRRGLSLTGEVRPFQQRTRRLGLKIGVSNVPSALEALDGPKAS